MSITSLSRFGPSGPRILSFNVVSSTIFEDEYKTSVERKGLRIYGHRANVDAGVTTDIWHGTVLLYPGWLQSPEPLRIRAGGNANDTANGSGARSVVLLPHDADFNWIDDRSVVLETAGAAASAPTAQPFIRCTQAFVLTSGAYANGANNGANVGRIVIETVSGTEVCAIDPNDGQSESSMFTVPRGHSLWLDTALVAVDTVNQAATIQMFQRPNADLVSAPVSSRQSVITVTGVDSPFVVSTDYSLRFPEKTDLWWRATAGPTNNNAIAVQYKGLLLKL